MQKKITYEVWQSQGIASNMGVSYATLGEALKHNLKSESGHLFEVTTTLFPFKKSEQTPLYRRAAIRADNDITADERAAGVDSRYVFGWCLMDEPDENLIPDYATTYTPVYAALDMDRTTSISARVYATKRIGNLEIPDDGDAVL